MIKPKVKVLSPVYPNLVLELDYRERLQCIVTAMHKSVLHWLKVAYRAHPPALAADEAHADLIAEMNKLGRRWTRKINAAAPQLAQYYAKKAYKRSDFALKSILKRAGMTVDFKLTPEMKEVLNATMQAQVGLIKSIGQDYLGEVEGLVMRSVQEGRNLETLTKAIEDRFAVSHERAAFIARDQNNKAFAAITRVRQTEIGVKRARWVHSGAGKHPRPEHVAYSKGQLGGPYYDIDKGAYLEGVWTWPGVEINCRCISRAVIEGFDV